MAKVKIDVTQAQEGALNDDSDDSTTLGANIEGTGNYGEIAAGDIAGVDRVLVTVDCTADGKLRFKAGDYPPSREAPLGDWVPEFEDDDRKTFELPTGRLIRNDGSIRIQNVAADTFAGTIRVLALPRSKAGRDGQDTIPGWPSGHAP